MKKLLAVVLAAVLALSLGIVSLAADNPYIDLSKSADDPDVTLDVAEYVKDGAKNGTNEMNPDDDLYFILPATVTVTATDSDGTEHTFTLNGEDFTDKDLYKVKYDKGDDNTKMISKMELSEKNFDGNRGPWLKVSVKQDYTDSEYKIAPFITLTTKEDIKCDDYSTAEDGDYAILGKGYKFDIRVGKFYINNAEDPADQDYMAGDGGVILKPTKNDDNEITWEDENNTIATLKFVGDDDGKYFYPKLSTKWEDADYAEYFADQNAFIFNFVASSAGKTKIASTSRATLELYNPYYDSDEDELTVEPEDVIIYMIGDDGALNDVTASFKPVENDDGDYVFQTKTRELGVYIIAQKPYTTAAAEDVETPDDGKAIPDTGIWA